MVWVKRIDLYVPILSSRRVSDAATQTEHLDTLELEICCRPGREVEELRLIPLIGGQDAPDEVQVSQRQAVGLEEALEDL